MAAATASKKTTPPKAMYARNAAASLGISLDQLSEELGKSPGQIKPRTPINIGLINTLEGRIGAKRKKPAATSPEAKPTLPQPSSEVGQALRVTDTVLHAQGKRKPRHQDFAIVKEVQSFLEAYWAVKLPYVPADIRQAGSSFVYNSPVTGKEFKLTLSDYSKYRLLGSFPIISEQDRRDVAAKLGNLWCARYLCIHCGDRLNPLLFSKLNVLLEKRFSLPLIGEGERLRFSSGHHECRLVMPKLVTLELDMVEFSGTDAEAIEYRKKQYAQIAGEVLPEVRVKQERIKRQDIFDRMLKILKFNHVNY